MKNFVVLSIFMLTLSFSVSSQIHYKKDGTPDMRYKENKQFYSPSYSTPIYRTPTYSSPSIYPTYPKKSNGTPDMRYKENKQLYGYPYRN